MTREHVEQLEQRLRALAASGSTGDWEDVLRRATSSSARESDRGIRRRRPLIAAVLLVAAVAVAAVVVPLELANRARADLLTRALSAVSGGPVLHAVLSATLPDSSVVDLRTGKTQRDVAVTEIWFDPAHHLLHEQVLVNGALDSDVLESPKMFDTSLGSGRISPAQTPTLDPALAAFFSGYTQALLHRRASLAGKQTIDGHTVEWIRFELPSGRTEEIGLDTRSYKPLYLRPICPMCTQQSPRSSVVVLDGVNRSSADFTPPLPIKSRPFAPDSTNRQVRVTVGSASSAFGTRALWAGRIVMHAPLTQILIDHISRYTSIAIKAKNKVGETRDAILFYGGKIQPGETTQPNGGWRRTPGQPSFTISESTVWQPDSSEYPGLFRPGPPRTLTGAPLPPAGEIALSVRGKHWLGALQKGRLYIVIGGPSRALVLAAALALTPIPRG